VALIMVTGPLGSGKSYYGVRKAVEALEQGKVVVTNFRMTPEWTDRVVDRHPLRWVIPGRRRKLKAKWARSVLVVPDLKTLLRVRLEGQGEKRGVVVIDEAHVFMNARSWRDEDRMELVEWASASRKLGFEVYLITQDLQSLDRQVRDRLTYHVTLRNLKQFKVAGIPIVPFNFFIAIWQFHTAAKAIVKREAYRLSWMAKLYDTMDLGAFGSLMNPEDAIRLPSAAPSEPPQAASAASATSAAGAAAPRRSALDASTERLLAIGEATAEVDQGEDG
jgi:Zonular occludens toxin (Zot)